MEQVYSYSAAGDIVALVICIICWLFLKTTYTTKHNNLALFHLVNRTLFIASCENILYNYLLMHIQKKYVFWVYVLENSIYIQLAFVFFLFVVYLSNIFELKPASKKILYMTTFPVFVLFAVYKLFIPFFQVGFYIDDDLIVHDANVFVYYYIYFSLALVVLIWVFKNRLIPRLVRCLYNVIALSFVIVLVECLMGTTTFTCVSFTFPVVAALFFFHYNAYDTKTGTLDFRSFHNYIENIKTQQYGVFCLYLKDYAIANNKDLSQLLVQFTDIHFTKYCTFRISDNKIFLVYVDDHITNEFLIERVKNDFNSLYQTYNIPYKLIYIGSHESLQDADDIIEMYNYISEALPFNTFYRCDEHDIEHLIKLKAIEKILYDIGEKHDLKDPRVKVYCQPILNIKKNTYTNAEALMRLEVDGVTYYPNDFIPVAEKHGYIHLLSKIMLNKVCETIKNLLLEGYEFDRISVNLSTTDFAKPDFCSNVFKIIQSHGIPQNKLAIEITESNDEAKYEQIKDALALLHLSGINFYLDDFGTGYSNFQRIFALSFDKIKFDKSLTALSGENEEFFYTIKSLASIFANAGYKIIYEGVETTADEERCKKMYATHLQGYKYSAPIKIEHIKDFFNMRCML